MAYSVSPSTSAVKVPPEITGHDTCYLETFVATDLDTTSRPATPAIDTIGLYSMSMFFHNTGTKSLTAYKVYGGFSLDSSGNIADAVDMSSATYWTVSSAITTLAADARSFFAWRLPGTFPRYVQVYLAAADANKTKVATTIIATYV